MLIHDSRKSNWNDNPVLWGDAIGASILFALIRKAIKIACQPFGEKLGNRSQPVVE